MKLATKSILLASSAAVLFGCGATDKPELSLGNSDGCKLQNGEVSCWDSSGETPVLVDAPELSNPSHISSAGNALSSHSCAIDDNGVTCWTDHLGEQLLLEIDEQPVNPVEIVSGNSFDCVVDDSGLTCWTWSLDLGEAIFDPSDDTYFASTLPTPEYATAPSQISAGNAQVCAISDGALACFAWSIDLSFGDELEIETVVANRPVPELTNPSKIFSGGYNSCATDDIGLNCWKTSLTLDTETFELVWIAAEIAVPEAAADVTSVAMGDNHFCAKAAEEVICWDDDEDAANDSDLKLQVPETVVNPKKLTANNDTTCALLQDDSVVCWNSDGVYEIPQPEPEPEV